MVDFTRYNPPGVYVEDVTAPVVNTTGIAPTVVALVGPALGYQTYTETKTVPTSSPGVFLAQTGIDASTVVVSKLDGTVLTLGDQDTDGGGADIAHGDYSLDLDSGSGQYVLRLVSSGTHVTPATSLVVQITYDYTADDYYEVQSFTDYDDLADVYGPALVTTAPSTTSANQVLSPLSLAAKVAFENGANQLLTVALDPAAGSVSAQFADAYSKLDSDDRTIILVPLYLAASQDQAGALSNAEQLLAHLHGVTDDGNPRVGIFGLTADVVISGSVSVAGELVVADAVAGPVGSDGQNVAKYVATNVTDSRLMVAFPNAMNLYNGNINQTTVVDGVYLAAAYAGRLSAVNAQQALTKQQIRGFSGLPVGISRGMTRTNKNDMSSHGVAVAEINRLGVLTVRHGVSTDMTNVLTREFSITRSRDALTRLLQDGMEATGLVGDAITEDTGTQVKAAVVGILEQAKLSGLFVDYQDVKVRQQSLAQGGDPTVIEVKFAYKPALPLNYIVITFSLDLSGGTIDLTAAVVA